MKKKGECALCKNKIELCHSHIIPEFMYQELYTPKHKFMLLTNDGNLKNRIEQKGYREYLLCDTCEGKFGNWERIGSKYLNKMDLSKRVHQYNFNDHDVDFWKFKFFVLSILWRMAISKNPIFSDYKLGPHVEKIRTILYEEDQANAWMYPISMVRLYLQGKHVKSLILPSGSFKINGNTCQRIIVAGYMFLVFTNSHKAQHMFRNNMLNENGIMRIIDDDIENMTVFKEFLTKITGSMNLPRQIQLANK